MPFIYPQNHEFRVVEQDMLTRGREGRLGLAIMPIRNSNASRVRWRQKDNFYGLQKLRGLDGSPTHVTRVGWTEYEYVPGVFGEYVVITETELTDRAGSVDILTVPIDIGDLVAEADELLMARENDRIESSNWAVLIEGELTIQLDGATGPQTGWTDEFDIQEFTAGVAWGTSATATPFRNFQSVQQLAFGHSVDLGAGAVAYMNSVTSNKLLNNTNSADLAGRLVGGGNTINSLADINRYLLAQNMAQVQVYDGGYTPTQGGSMVRFIPDDTVVVIGKRPSGVPVGNYVMTRNMAGGNNGKPGSYRMVKDFANGTNAEKRVPPSIEIHRGHNGGPTIEYPSSVVVMHV